MELKYQRITVADRDRLVDWLCQEPWPFHGRASLTSDQVRNDFDEGLFTGDYIQSFWILQGEERVGFFRVFDLEDLTPMFDIRIRGAFRGQGIGRSAVIWLTRHVFESFAHVMRIEAHTRVDNVAMCHVLELCGYKKEAHHRKAWPDQQGRFFDSVGYAILREGFSRPDYDLYSIESSGLNSANPDECPGDPRMDDLKFFDDQLRFVLRLLDEQSYEFALTGAFALHFYGYTRATLDIDIVTRSDYRIDLIQRLESIGFETLYQSEGYSNHIFHDTFIRFDFIYLDGQTADQVLQNAVSFPIDDSNSVPVVSPEHLVALKLFAIRNDPDRTLRELADIKELIKRHPIDHNIIRGYAQEYGISPLLYNLLEYPDHEQ